MPFPRYRMSTRQAGASADTVRDAAWRAMAGAPVPADSAALPVPPRITTARAGNILRNSVLHSSCLASRAGTDVPGRTARNMERGRSARQMSATDLPAALLEVT